jgi:type III pantothenate kinase
MSLILTLDNGNTNPHIGVFKKNKLVEVFPLKNLVHSPLINEKNIKAIISNVGKPIDLPQNFDFAIPPIKVSDLRLKNTFLKMPVHYSQTLGEDRLCLSYYAFQKVPRFPIVVIDVGTFTTIDFIDAQGFQGGYIFPGPKTFLESYNRGQNLPVLPIKNTKKIIPHQEKNVLLPQDTIKAIEGSWLIFLKSIYEFVSNELRPKEVILTGGLSHTLAPFFTSSLSQFKVQIEPHLIHYALFTILENHIK